MSFILGEKANKMRTEAMLCIHQRMIQDIEYEAKNVNNYSQSYITRNFEIYPEHCDILLSQGYDIKIIHTNYKTITKISWLNAIKPDYKGTLTITDERGNKFFRILKKIIKIIKE